MSYWKKILLVFVLSSCGFTESDSIKFNSVVSLGDFRIVAPSSKLGTLINKELNGEVELKAGGEVVISEWKTYESSDQQLRFSIPTEWAIAPEEGYLLSCQIDEQKGSYFVCIAHQKDKTNLNLDGYKDFVIESCLSDTTEHFQLNEISLHTGKSRASYYLQMDSIKEGKARKYYGFLTENENFVFDISYCVVGEQNQNFSPLFFMSVLHSFRINGTPILNSKAIITDLDVSSY